MADRPLTDNQIDDMLFEMQQRLRGCKGVTTQGDTALKAIDRMLDLIRISLVAAAERVQAGGE